MNNVGNNQLHLWIADLKKQLDKQSAEQAKLKKELREETARRRRTELVLHECRKIFYSFMKYLPALAFMKDHSGRYLYCNEAHKKMLNVYPADCIGKTDEELWPPELAKRLKGNDNIVMSKGKALNTVEVLTVKDEIQHYLTSKFPIFKHGKPFLLGGVAINITNKINTEEKFRKKENSEYERRTEYEAKNDIQIPADFLRHPELQIPDSLPGLDIRKGLKRLDGSWELYLDILSFFCKDRKNFVRDFRNLIEKKEFETALIKAHALKGSAATISATELCKAAKILEEACRNKNTEQILDLLYPVEKALEQVMVSCKKIPVLTHTEDDITKSAEIGNKVFDISNLSVFFENFEKAFRNLIRSNQNAALRKSNPVFPLIASTRKPARCFRN